MVKSMTGYGRGEAVVHGRSITVELRSVNNRYLDCTIKLPRIYVFAEDAIKSKVQAHISRGKVDVFVTIGPSENGDVSISVNKPVADGYYAALCALRDSYGLKDDISVSLLSRFQDVFLVEKTQEDVEAMAADICSVLELALADFDAMRRFQPDVEEVREHKGCRCGDVLRGIMAPSECPLFRKICTPENPVGPCMVSSEGSCAAYYRYY